jgi:hypothetical protein
MSTSHRSGSRRQFFQHAAGITAAVSAASSTSVASAAQQAPAAPPIPRVKFGKIDITRLIIGSNPLYGYSHFNRIYDACMREWYTQERRMEVLHRAERNGINTWQVHYNDQPMADFARYRAEGGKMHLVLLADFALMKDVKLMPEVAKLGPLGIAHHGGRTDDRFRNGQKNVVREYLKAVRDSGVMVGLSTHNPAVVDTVESEGWDIDYYQTCLYRLTRTPEEARAEFKEAALGESFMERDPERMCKMIRQTRKPCLAFKVYGAGRTVGSAEAIENSVRYALTNIKATDAVIVGMFPKFKDEVAENAALVRRILQA